MSNDRELGLETLLAAKTELRVDLEEEFLEACFKIQQRYQFSHDRNLSTAAMKRLIEGYVDKMSGNATKSEA